MQGGRIKSFIVSLPSVKRRWNFSAENSRRHLDLQSGNSGQRNSSHRLLNSD